MAPCPSPAAPPGVDDQALPWCRIVLEPRGLAHHGVRTEKLPDAIRRGAVRGFTDSRRRSAIARSGRRFRSTRRDRPESGARRRRPAGRRRRDEDGCGLGRAESLPRRSPERRASGRFSAPVFLLVKPPETLARNPKAADQGPKRIRPWGERGGESGLPIARALRASEADETASRGMPGRPGLNPGAASAVQEPRDPSRTTGTSVSVKTTISSAVLVLMSWCRLTTPTPVHSRIKDTIR